MAASLLVGSIVLTSAAASSGRPIDFPTRVLPILTKAGCNAGACHGAAVGQGGFKLSLLGYDPEKDYETITRELAGRRVDLAAPDESLFLLKPTSRVDHDGGRRIKLESAAHQTLRSWIAGGAPFGPRDLRVAAIEVAPSDSLLEKTNQSVALRVTALLSDGMREDVTTLALYTSNDDGVAEVDASGRVTTRDRGLTSIMVRYSGQVAAARIGVPLSDAELDRTEFRPRNFIDEKVFAELRRLRIPPSPLSDDAEFLRRIYLDVSGCLPTPDEIRAFLREPESSEKRLRVIDALLHREEFIDFWTMKFADLLLISGKRGAEAATRTYHAWLREQVAKNRPFDELARELVTASGELAKNGPANFFTLAADPRDLGEHVSSIFLGTQIACARCHAHPYAKWTQDDYHRFAAFFARVTHDGGLVRVGDHGEVEHPKTGKSLLPKPLGALASDVSVQALATLPLTPALSLGERESLVPALGESPNRSKYSDAGNILPLPRGEGRGEGKDDARLQKDSGMQAEPDRRLSLAHWLTAPDNSLFSQALVNRVWKHLLGRGLAEPVDDLRPTNPPPNPALMDALAADFASNGWDVRRLIRTIVSSRTYQLSSRVNEINRRDDRLFSHGYLKPLAAQVLADAISQAAGAADEYPGYPAGARAVELVGSQTPSYALDVFGRCSRERNCETSVRGGGLAQALHLINGSTVNGKLREGVLKHLSENARTDEAMIEELYLRTLCRPVSPTEIKQWRSMLAAAHDKAEVLEDLLWALLNSREFAFNH